VDVRCSEAQEPKPGIDEQILSAIILDESLAMIAAVVLENELRRGVVQVGPTDEPALGVVEILLDLWSRQAGLDQKPAKPSFHRRFRGSHKPGKRSQLARARATFRCLDIAAQSGRIGEPGTHRHVDGNKGFNGRALQAKTGEGEGQCRCAHPADGCDFSRSELTATNTETDPRPDSRIRRHHNLDWIGGVEVQAEQPGRCGTSEDRIRRE
jgi:hypothetical protein